MTQIALAVSDSEIDRCFPIMQELRPHLLQTEFVNRVKQQQQQGYRLAYLKEEDDIKALAGFRLSQCLASGKFLYVDDLITQPGERSKGYGDRLMSWLVDYARSHACDQLQLDSGVQRFAAHRFYFRQRLEITSYHFALKL
jgi:GNAT superfamily N-acetyltransferase